MKKILLALCALTFSISAEALVRINLDNPNSNPTPVAFVTFLGSTPEEKELALKLTNVIRNDFKNTGLFNVIDSKAFLQSERSVNMTGPYFPDWKILNTEALISGKIHIDRTTSTPKLEVEFRLFDVYSEKQETGRRYTAKLKFWRHIAHRISDDVYTTITNEKGYFATRVVYISEELKKDENDRPQLIKKLCVMDQDSANQQCLTNGDHLVLTPHFSPTAQKVVYMSYASGRPRLYLLDLPTGEQEMVGDFEGLNSAPRFSPDGKHLLMTLTKGHAGNPDIYEMEVATKKLRRLTFHRGIDTSPSYSPDGKKIVFNSDRGGRAALYVMNSNGNKIKRLTYGRGRYYAPVWSPRGDLIAFVKGVGSRFHIGVIDADGTEERLLTDSYLDESPSWSPNGRVIIFARQKGDDTGIYTIDLTGYNERRLSTPTNATDPSWSPLLR